MEESRLCPKCSVQKTKDDFYRDNKRKDGLQLWCIDCNRIIAREFHRKMPQHVSSLRARKTRLKSKYGLTLEDYERMLNSQGGVCAICGRPETSKSNYKYARTDSLRVDHCHTTGKIRGLLCSECNFGISKFDDNLGIIMSAVEYLLKFKQGLTAEEKVKLNASTSKN